MYMLQYQRGNLSEILSTAGIFSENCKVAPKRKVLKAVYNNYKIQDKDRRTLVCVCYEVKSKFNLKEKYKQLWISF